MDQQIMDYGKDPDRVYLLGNRWVLEIDGQVFGKYLTLDNLMADMPVRFHGASRDGDLHFWYVSLISDGYKE